CGKQTNGARGAAGRFRVASLVPLSLQPATPGQAAAIFAAPIRPVMTEVAADRLAIPRSAGPSAALPLSAADRLRWTPAGVRGYLLAPMAKYGWRRSNAPPALPDPAWAPSRARPILPGAVMRPPALAGSPGGRPLPLRLAILHRFSIGVGLGQLRFERLRALGDPAPW